LLESLQVGCVGLSPLATASSRPSASRARLAARVELEPVQELFMRRGWERAVGSPVRCAIADSLRELRRKAAR
jgi:hypothetical protein